MVGIIHANVKVIPRRCFLDERLEMRIVRWTRDARLTHRRNRRTPGGTIPLDGSRSGASVTFRVRG
ncbi:MAG: hypothetical protein CMJ27_05410 [Phycisphaerae bacterium]|nr:hypothetical protein [Phycisphaerae bacterium]